MLNELIWKFEVPSKVKAFVWFTVLNQINANNVLHVRRPNKALSPDVCARRANGSGSPSHLFFYCLET